MTPAGEKVLGEIKGVDKGKNSDGNTAYVVPLAERKIVADRQDHDDQTAPGARGLHLEVGTESPRQGVRCLRATWCTVSTPGTAER